MKSRVNLLALCLYCVCVGLSIGATDHSAGSVPEAEYGFLWPADLAVDSSGNVCVGGIFGGSVDFDPGPGLLERSSTPYAQEPPLIRGRTFDVFAVMLDPEGELRWVQTWGGNSSDHLMAVAVDSSGSIYTAGSFEGVADFDPGLDRHLVTSRCWGEPYPRHGIRIDTFLSKLDSEGALEWVKTWGSDFYNDHSEAVAVGGNDCVYVVGRTADDQIDVDPGPAEDIRPGAYFLVCLDSKGQFQWADTWEDIVITDIAIGPEGQVFVAGGLWESGDVDPGPASDWRDTRGGIDVILMSLDPSGGFLWCAVFGGAFDEEARRTAVDGLGCVYVTGDFIGAVDFDPGDGIDERVPDGGHDTYLAKFNPDGCFQWVRTWGGPGAAVWPRIATNGQEAVYLGGSFGETVDFDPGPTTQRHDAHGSSDVFLSRFDTNGEFLWVHTWGGIEPDRIQDITADASGNVWVIGLGSGFEGLDATGESEAQPVSDRSVFLIKFDSQGKTLWVRSW